MSFVDEENEDELALLHVVDDVDVDELICILFEELHDFNPLVLFKLNVVC